MPSRPSRGDEARPRHWRGPRGRGVPASSSFPGAESRGQSLAALTREAGAHPGRRSCGKTGTDGHRSLRLGDRGFRGHQPHPCYGPWSCPPALALRPSASRGCRARACARVHVGGCARARVRVEGRPGVTEQATRSPGLRTSDPLSAEQPGSRGREEETPACFPP